MDLMVEINGIPARVTAVENSHAWDVSTLQELDPNRLSAMERSARLGCGPLAYIDKHGAWRWREPRCAELFKYTRRDLLNLLVELDNGRDYVRLGDILKHQNGVTGSNLKSQLTKLRDLGKLPRFIPGSYAHLPARNAEYDSLMNYIQDATILSNEDFVELQEEFPKSQFLVYHSWMELAQATSWAEVQEIMAAFNLEGDLEDKVIVLQLKADVKDYDWVLKEETPHGIFPQCYEEHFFHEFPDVPHTADSRRFYYETEPLERNMWLGYTERSVYNQPLPEPVVSQANLDSKACRDLRFRLLVNIVHDVYEWCKTPHRWEFSPHFWYEDGACGRGKKYQLAIDLKTMRGSKTVKPAVNVYTRYGQAARTAEISLHGPGIVYRPSTDENLTPAEMINSFYRRVFGLRKGWNEKRESFLGLSRRLKQSKKAEERNKAAIYYAAAQKMGVFLTQEQLHVIRQLTEWLYDRFQVPEKQRLQVKEKYPVARTRLNDLQEEMRKVQADIEILEREITLESSRQQLQARQRRLQGLIRKAKQLNVQQLRLAKDLGPEEIQTLEELQVQQRELTVKELEHLTESLEEEIRALMDPGHKFFDCELPTAKQIYRKDRLEQRLQQLRARLAETEDDRIVRLADMLNSLTMRYDFCATAQEVYIEDLPAVQRLLGWEVDEQ